MNEIGKNIRFLRQQRKMSQDQLAEALHVTRQTVSNYETGRSRPDIKILTVLSEALNADVKEILYGPADREAHIRRLRHLAVGVVLTGLVGVLYFAGSTWAQQLLKERFLAFPAYMMIFFVKPLFYSLFGWMLCQGSLVLLRTAPLRYRWAVWAQRGLLAMVAVWLICMTPLFLFFFENFIEDIQHLFTSYAHSRSDSLNLNPIALFTYRHVNLLPWISFLLGMALGILGFPGRRMVKATAEANTAQMEKADSPE